MNIKFYIAILLMFIFSKMSMSQIDVKLSTASDTIEIGSLIPLKLELSIEEGDSVTWPVFKDTISSSLELVLQSNVDSVFLENVEEIYGLRLYREYTVLSFDTAFVVVPPIELIVNGDTLKSNPLLLYIDFPEVDLLGEIKDVKDIIQVRLTLWESIMLYRTWVILGILLVIGVLLLLVWNKRRKSKPSIKSIPKLPKKSADGIAFERLTALHNKDLYNKGLIKDHYIELSNIFRLYVEDRFQISATEETTKLLLSNLKRTEVHRGDMSKLKRILELSDMVKFAKAKPSIFDHERIMKDSRNFILNTKKEVQE